MIRALLGRAATRPWGVAFAGVAVLVVLQHLLLLGTSPPGLYIDEASIGYDAWSIAHHGVDQHHAAFPLFFQSFDDWKSPVYHYLLAPLTLVLPLTPATVRLPAALCGLATCAFAVLAARRLVCRPPVTLLLLLTAATMPWLVVQSRLGFEVVTLTTCLAAMLWCLVHAELGDGDRWWWWVGAALGLSVFTYPSGRLLAAMLVAALVVAHLPLRRPLRWWRALPGPLLAYGILGAWSLRHPGALTVRFQEVGITADHAGVGTVLARFAGNYLGYFDLPFLVLRGDPNPRHSTQLGGVLLVASLPAVVLGVIACLRRRREPLARFSLLALLAAPIPAALTQEGTPHALRAGTMIAVLLLLSAYGWPEVQRLLATHRALARALVAAAALQGVAYFADLYVTYPPRVERAFDAGEGDALVRAHALAGGGWVIASDHLELPYIQLLFALHPAPDATLARTVDDLHLRTVAAGAVARTAAPGDVVVLAAGDTPPAGAMPLFEERVPGAWGAADVVVARAFRMGAVLRGRGVAAG